MDISLLMTHLEYGDLSLNPPSEEKILPQVDSQGKCQGLMATGNGGTLNCLCSVHF